jgi:hypothetical protein
MRSWLRFSALFLSLGPLGLVTTFFDWLARAARLPDPLGLVRGFAFPADVCELMGAPLLGCRWSLDADGHSMPMVGSAPALREQCGRGRTSDLPPPENH